MNTVPNGVVRLDNIKVTADSSPVEPTPDPTPTQEEVIITNCDVLTGWTKVNSTQNALSITTERAQAQSDDGAIAANTGHGFFQAYYELPSAVNVSGCDAFEWDVCFTGAGGWQAIQNAYKEIGYVRFFSNGNSPANNQSNSLVFRFDALEITDINGTWVHMKAVFDDATVKRNFDASALTAFRFYTSENTYVNTVPDGVIRMDNVKATKQQEQVPEGVYPIPGKFSKTDTTGSFAFVSSEFSYDLSAYQKSDLYLIMDVTVENTDGTDNMVDLTRDGQIELTSSGKSDVQELNWSVPRLSLKSGLNKVRVSLADAGTTTNGIFDLSSVNYFRFYSQKNGDSTFNVKIENIAITTHKEERIVSTYFSDGMMFKQNSPMNVFGNVKEGGKNIRAVLFKNGVSDEEKTAISEENGDWKLSFSSRAGSYDTYKIDIYVNSKLETSINDIAIGELWLASGQSNMEYTVGQTVMNNDYTGLTNTNVRFFDEPVVPGGVNSKLSAVPVTDIEGARWANGGNPVDIKYVSAIGYMMSLKLQSSLDVPVGFINTAKGASVIESWLPREAIENNQLIKSTLQNRNIYYTEEQLADVSANWQYLTTLYNTKIAPLAGIEISGVLWYQGESNVKYADDDGYNTFYKNALEDMLTAYSDLFGFEEGKMPFICAHLAPYNNAHIRANDYLTIQADFSDMLNDVAKSGKSRMIHIPIYDLPLTYKDPPIVNQDPIHPNSKREVADRFANAALASFYGIGNADAGNAPTVSSMKINGKKVVLTFKNVGAGLTVLGGEKTIHGFAIADKSRVFTEATARLTSANTVEVYNDNITSPVAVTYAWSSFNMLSNLANSLGIPALPYRSDKVKSTYYLGMDWGYFDSDALWNPLKTTDSGFENAYTVSDGAVLSFTDEGCIEGKANAKLDIIAKKATLSPVVTLGSSANQFDAYTGITVYVKNGGASTPKLSMQLSVGDEVYYPSIVTGTKLDSKYEISGTDYKPYTFNFARIMNGEGKVLANSSTLLKTVSSISFAVECDSGSTVYFDNAYLRTDALPTPGSDKDVLVEATMWFSDAESKDKWASNGGVVIDTENFTQGKSSVGTTAKDGVLKQIVYKPGADLDVSDYDYLEFDVYFSNMKWFTNKEIMFELTSSGVSDNESNRYMLSYLKSNAEELCEAGKKKSGKPGWYHVKLDLNNPQTIARGGMNKKSCNYFRFFTISPTEDVPDFDVRFDNMRFTKKPNGGKPSSGGYGDPSYGIVIDNTAMWMSTAENMIWWKATGASVELDSKNKTQGETSISVEAKKGILKQLAFTPDHAVDVSDYQYLEFDAYFSNLDWLHDCKGMMFELTSAGTCDKESSRYTKSSILESSPAIAADYESGANGGKWYHFKLNLSTPHSKVKGGLNLKNFNYFRFYTVEARDTTSDYTLKLDNIRFTKGEAPASIVKTAEKIIINPAESAALWTSPGQEVMLDTANKVSGNGSVSVIAKGGILKELAYHPASPIDLTGYNYLQFDLFLSDITCLSTSTGFMVEVTSSGTCDVESNRYMKTGILAACPELAKDIAGEVKGNKWYHFCFDLTRPQNQARGGLNMAAMNFFRIYFIGSPAGTPDCTVNLDNLEVTVNGVSSTANSGGQIVFAPGGSSGKNIGNKVNMGLVSNHMTEIPSSLVTTAVSLGAAVIVILAAAVAFVVFFIAKKRKR